jgi:uncharacterized protein (DUF952 family)
VRIFHLATATDWAEAQRTGTYTTSTRGRTLEQEGFIHASREDQWRGVHQRFYADEEDELVLLEIDTERLESEVREDQVGDDTFPHVYGPINVDSVIQTHSITDS